MGFNIKCYKKKPQKCYSVKGTDMAYRDIYSLASQFYEIMTKHRATFCKLPKNKYEILGRISKWILDNRELKGYGEVDEQWILDHFSKLKEKENKPLPTHLYIYDQRYLFMKMYNLWCPLGIERKDTTQNDRLRVFGIVLLPDYRDEFDCITRKRANDREEMDNPRYHSKHIFQLFADSFNDRTLHIRQPKEYLNIPNASLMDPNDQTRIAVKRDGKWFKNVFDTTMKWYCEACVKKILILVLVLVLVS